MAGGKTFSRPARCGRATHLAGLQDVEIGRGHCICSGRGATHLAGLQGVGIKGIRHCIYSCRGQHICCGTTHITAGSTQGDGNIARSEGSKSAVALMAFRYAAPLAADHAAGLAEDDAEGRPPKDQHCSSIAALQYFRRMLLQGKRQKNSAAGALQHCMRMLLQGNRQKNSTAAQCRRLLLQCAPKEAALQGSLGDGTQSLQHDFLDACSCVMHVSVPAEEAANHGST
eukprot:1147118-Pelagomonas_calceolata.AAC.1